MAGWFYLRDASQNAIFLQFANKNRIITKDIFEILSSSHVLLG